MYEKRSYRDRFKGESLVFYNVCIYETDLCIGSELDLCKEAHEAVALYRAQLETYIRLYPDFLKSLVPINPQPGAPTIVTRMCEAASKAGVGPMAAVAGAVSELVGRELLKYSRNVIVENGGDIFINTVTTRKVGIYAGNSPLSDKIAVEISPEKTPMGICTSSGTVGPSLSFGKADAALIISKDTFLADAAATALGNRVKAPEDIQAALDFAGTIDGVDGALVIISDKIGAWGDIKLTAF